MRPLNLGQTLDAAMNITRRRFRALASIAFLLGLPIGALTVLITAATTKVYDVNAQYSFSEQHDRIVATSDGAFVAGQVAIGLLLALLHFLVTVGCLRIVAEDHLGRAAGARESLRFAVRRAPQLAWTGIVMLVLLALSLVTIIGPLLLGIAWSFALLVVTLEGPSGFPALTRSFRLVEGRWWKTFGRLAVGSLIVGIGSGLISAIAAALVTVVVEPTSSVALVGVGIGDVIAWSLTMPFTAALTAVVYFDLRIRKEGFDLAALAMELGAPPPLQPVDAGAVAGGYIPPASASQAASETFAGFAPPVPPSADREDR